MIPQILKEKLIGGNWLDDLISRMAECRISQKTEKFYPDEPQFISLKDYTFL